MHLVFFTQNKNLEQHFQNNFAPILKKEFFSDETSLKSFLKNLKVPTQVIIDKKTFKGSLQAFAKEMRFHHIIIFSQEYTFEDSLDMVRQGVLLINAQQLMAPQWWWNRTLMQITRKKIQQLNLPAVVLIPPTSVVNLYQMIYEHTDKLFFQDKDVSLLYLSSTQSLEANLATLKNFAIKHREMSTLTGIYCAQNFLYAPYERCYFLSQLRKLLPQATLFIETDGSQNMTEHTLDQAVALGFPGIYQLNQRKAEKKIYQEPTVLRDDHCFDHVAELLDLEYLRYTWQPETKNHQAFLTVRS